MVWVWRDWVPLVVCCGEGFELGWWLLEGVGGREGDVEGGGEVRFRRVSCGGCVGVWTLRGMEVLVVPYLSVGVCA